MILLDTHALLWWALDPDKLSPAAAEHCARMEQDGGFASAISIWELGVKIRNGKLDLGLPLVEFVRRLQQSAVVELVPVDTTIWLRTVSLDWAHRDPADRVILSTAIEKGLPVLTRDELLHTHPAVRCIW
jgi:PIN domain nuclease of toxin-antitoxin system